MCCKQQVCSAYLPWTAYKLAAQRATAVRGAMLASCLSPDSTLPTLPSPLSTTTRKMPDKFSTFYLHLHSSLYIAQLTFHICNPHSTIYTLQSSLYASHSPLYTLHATLRTLHLALRTLHFTLQTWHSTPYKLNLTLHFTLHTLNFTLYTLRSALHTLHSTLDCGV